VNKQDWQEFGIFLGVIIFISFISYLIYQGGYKEGYCDALGMQNVGGVCYSVLETVEVP
jgi:hypothetical protein